MFGKLKYYIYLLAAILLVRCKEPFEPNLPVVPQGYLVVEGFINAQGITQIKLSRTIPLDQKKTFKPELNASLQIEGENSTVFTLTGAPNGNYNSANLNLNTAARYRLRIKTKEGKEYLSDYVTVKLTPAIDSVSWKEEEHGVTIYMDTHDPQNNTTYYRWDYDETWEIRSAYFAFYKYQNGRIVERSLSEPNIYYCWKYDTSKSVLIGSSAKLEKDVIHLNPVRRMAIGDERLGVRYSIQVRQYALDKGGYQFFEQIKKNTESLGSIFDPQPSALKGNIRAVSNPDEIVIGYIVATSVQQKRIFIGAAQLAERGFNINSICPSYDVANHPDSIRVYVPPYWPYDALFGAAGIVAYKVAASECVDCRERGGINVKPNFW